MVTQCYLIICMPHNIMKSWLIDFMIFVTPFIIVLMKSGIMSKSKENPYKGENINYPRSRYKLFIDIFVSFFIVWFTLIGCIKYGFNVKYIR